MFKNLREEIDSVMHRDPAARSRLEVLLAYPGFHAILVYRLAHLAWRNGFRLSARIIANLGRWIGGVDIHPGARIGRRLFIDHGLGVVIGETAEIGDDVTLYQGVTLGGVSPSIDSASQIDRKRHPTIGDHVIIGSGAQVLGPITVGEGARIGANAVVVRDVAPGITMVGVAARPLPPKECRKGFMAYGTPISDLPDPVARAIEGLVEDVRRLSQRLQSLESAPHPNGAGNGAQTPAEHGEAARLTTTPQDDREHQVPATN